MLARFWEQRVIGLNSYMTAVYICMKKNELEQNAHLFAAEPTKLSVVNGSDVSPNT